ncbi:MAG TPA: 30S ribosomal protein S3 [Euryarchaeota archaeon]|nr:30S ribosomal protein S3 [Euryarchaeota archaeon]
MVTERKFVTENIRRVLLKEYMMKQLDRAGFGGLDIQRTPMGTRVTLVTERPGLVIGRRGAAIKALTKAIEEDFNFDNPQIEVQQVDNANLNSQIMAEKLATALERGWHFRRAGHSTVRRIMEAGAKGCQVIIAGKLTGQRHRTEKFREGNVKYCGDPKIMFMREGFAVAKLKSGVIGVKAQIMDPNARLPDEVIITAAATAPAETLEAGSPGTKISVEEQTEALVTAEGDESSDVVAEESAEGPVEEPASEDQSDDSGEDVATDIADVEKEESKEIKEIPVGGDAEPEADEASKPAEDAVEEEPSEDKKD